MALYERSGTCNLCGECCGAPPGDQYGPPFRGHNQVNNTDPNDNPWFLKLIPSSWQDEAMEDYGSVNIATVLVRWIWVLGVGLCTDLPPAGKEPWATRCPFLLYNDGETEQPCLLYADSNVVPWLQGTDLEGWTYRDIWDNY